MLSGKRSLGLFAAGALSAGIIALVAGALWMLGSASGERAKFSSLQIAPQDADVFVAINTDPTSPQWLAVNDSLGALNAKDPIRRSIDEALAEVNLNWEEDILPVAGDEAFFAVPDVSKVKEEEGFVAGFLVRDTARAQEVFDSLKQRSEADGETYETEEYEGVTIYYTAKPDIDGDPSTQSDCTVDEDGTQLCDGQVTIPANPYFRCVAIADELDSQGSSPAAGPEECQPFFECPIYRPDDSRQHDTEDADNDGIPDSCQEADRIMQDWEFGVDYTSLHQDCADLGDLSQPECQDLSNFSGEGAVALFEEVLAVGASPDDVKSVIDVVHGRAPSAETNQRLQEFRDGQKEDFLMWGYADLAPVWDLAEAAIPENLGTSGGSDTPAGEPEPIEISTEPAPPGDTGFSVASFDADYTIEDGAIAATERITVDFGQTPRHGFSRDISTHLTYDFVYDVIATIDLRSVSRDGLPEQFAEPSVGGNYHRIAIGDANAPLTGEHTYEIKYLARGAIINVEPDGGEDPYYDIVWNITGDNWGVSIDQASATLTIPDATITFSPCGVGPDPLPWVQEGCSSTQEGFGAERFTADVRIEPGSRMEFRASVYGVSSGASDPPLIPNSRLPFDVEGEEPQQDFPFDFNSEELLKELRGAYDRVGFSIAATADGYALDLTVLHAADHEPRYAALPTTTFDSHFAESVPASTMFFFAGYDIYGQNWLPAQEYLDDQELMGASFIEGFLGEFETQAGLDLEEDILALLTGEYAVAGDISNFDQTTPDFSILVLLDVADAGRAQQSLDKIGEYLESENMAEITSDRGVQRWSVPGSDAEAVGITVTGDDVIAGYPDSAVSDAVAGFDDALSGTNDWKRAMAILPAQTTSVGFLSVARILEEVRKMPDAERSFEESTDGELRLEDLTPIRSVGFASTTRENGFGLHFALFMEDR